MANKEFSKINSIDGSNDVYIVKDASAVSSVSLSGRTLTVVKRDGSSATYTTQDNQGVTSVTITNGTGIAINSTAAITNTGTRTISLASGVITTTGTYGNTAQQTPLSGETFNIPYVTVDTYGRVTSAGITTVKLPMDNNTWNPLTTGQAGYVSQAPGDTTKFLRGDARWESVTKANVGLDNVENIALSTWTGNTSISSIGTLTTGTIPWARLSNIPTASTSTTGIIQITSNNLNSFINTLTTSTSIPKDTDYYISQYPNGGTTNTAYYRRTHNALYNYIKEKIGINTTGTAFLRQDGQWATPEGTAYSAGTGLTLSGNTINHTNSVTTQNVQALYPIKIDAQGHIFSYGTAITQLPASDVSAWAKASTKPSYSLNEITNAEDVQAIEALTGTSGFLKKTSANTWTLDTTTYLSSHQSLSNYVQGPSNATSGHIAIFDGTTGKLIKDGTYTIAKSVPSDAKFTDTIYASGTGIEISSGNIINNIGIVDLDTSGNYLLINGTTTMTIPYATNANSAINADSATSATKAAQDADGNVITNTYATKAELNNLLASKDAMVFKGTIGASGATTTALPASHNAGDTYKVITSGIYAGANCEIGDLIICIADGVASANNDWTIVQTNIDGAVTGPTSATTGAIAIFDGNSGKVIKQATTSTATVIKTATLSSGSLPTLGTAISVPNVTNATNITASKVTKADVTLIKTVSQAASTSSILGTVNNGVLTFSKAITAVGAVTTTTGNANTVTINDVTASQVTLGTAISIPNITNVGTLPSLTTTTQTVLVDIS